MSIVKDLVDNITGRAQRKATERGQAAQEDAIDRAIDETRTASLEGLEFLSPFAGIGELGIENAGFLLDDEAQFDFLQNNPLFQFSLDRLDEGTNAFAASRGRLGAGDTLAQLQQNAILAGQPLIDRRANSIRDFLNLGSGIAQSQAKQKSQRLPQK